MSFSLSINISQQPCCALEKEGRAVVKRRWKIVNRNKNRSELFGSQKHRTESQCCTEV